MYYSSINISRQKVDVCFDTQLSIGKNVECYRIARVLGEKSQVQIFKLAENLRSGEITANFMQRRIGWIGMLCLLGKANTLYENRDT